MRRDRALKVVLVLVGLLFRAGVIPLTMFFSREPAVPVHSSLQKMKQVYLTTDGACIRNPGPGGWACVLRTGNRAGEISGCDPHTTNNRMELRAVIEGLRALPEQCKVIVRSDSQYVQRGVTKWIKRWKSNGWKTTDGRPVLNQDYWRELDKLNAFCTPDWQWIKGHADDADNIRCDLLAKKAARQQIASNGLNWLEEKQK